MSKRTHEMTLQEIIGEGEIIPTAKDIKRARLPGDEFCRILAATTARCLAQWKRTPQNTETSFSFTCKCERKEAMIAWIEHLVLPLGYMVSFSSESAGAGEGAVEVRVDIGISDEEEENGEHGEHGEKVKVMEEKRPVSDLPDAIAAVVARCGATNGVEKN